MESESLYEREAILRAARRLILATAVVTVGVLGWQEQGFAQAAAGQFDDSGIQAEATNPGTGTAQPVSLGQPTSAGGTAIDGGSTGGTSTPSPYTYRRIYDFGPCVPIPGQTSNGILYRDMRTDTRTGEEVEVASGCERPETPDDAAPAAGEPAAAPSPGALATQAVNRTPLPAPEIEMAPGGNIPQLVNLATFLWINPAQWVPQTASATAGGVTSTVTATPERVVWDMGQGDSVTCEGPGLPYEPNLPDDAQPSDCKFTYRASSAGRPDKTFIVRATIEYHVTWSASGAAGGGDLGISRRSSTTPVRVAELQALNIAAAAS